MPEESLREIIGLAKKSKWIQVKKFIKFIIEKTLEKEAGYNLTALDVSINGKNKSKYTVLIKNKENIKEIDKISDFTYLSLYQVTRNSNNLIDISQNNGTIIILAKYFGPPVDNHQIFDFSVQLDAIGEPFFTIGSGRKINGSEILEIINKNTKPIIKTKRDILKKKSTQVKDPEIKNIEAFVFEKLIYKKAIWNGSETKNFQNWKAKIKNKYQVETGKITHYKGKPTKKFSLYLKNLIKKRLIKNKKLKKNFNKNTSKPNKQRKEILEKKIFETLTGKNAIWNESETKNFKDWKNRLYKKYSKDTGRKPYYKGNLTQSYKKYLRNLIKSNFI